MTQNESSAAHRPVDDGGAQTGPEAIAELQQENAQLREQVRRLMAAENKLYRLQDHLSAQQRVYVRLAELGRTLTSLLDVDQIAKAVSEFVVYGFNYQCCVTFLWDTQSTSYRVRAFEGYYDTQSAARVSSAFLSGQEASLIGIDGELGFVCHRAQPDAAEIDVLAQTVMLDEYFVFALPRKGGGLAGFLVAGNTREQAPYQSEVAAEGEMLVAFSNLANHAATAIERVRSYRALERERELLDQTVADRTRELSEALDTAHEAVRLKAEFLANVSHELRTPLNSIVNVPSALLADYAPVRVLDCANCSGRFQSDDGTAVNECPDCGAVLASSDSVACLGDPAEHYRFLKLLQQQGTHLLSLVEDVLDFSRLEAGRMELSHTVIDLAEIFAEVESTIRGTGRLERRALVFPTLSSSIALVADRTKFKQVILNLVGNALKFTKAEGRIELRVVVQPSSTQADQATVITEVIDDGIGIPPDQLDAIFESFRQVDGSHTRSAGGAGLGLAICRQLVEMHGGAISVSSQLGAGSTFRVCWPQSCAGLVARSASSRPPEVEAAAPLPPIRVVPGGFGRVVVVDDDPAQLSMARKLLEREGYEVVLVSRAEQAVEAIRSAQPRLVLLDVMMPNLNGLMILSQLKHHEQTKAVPVIVSTAFHYNRKKAVELGALWLPKPWSSRNLTATSIERMLEEAADSNGEQEAAERARQRRTRLAESVSTILYVEDEDANWEVTELSLRGKYRLARAKNAEETFEQLRRGTFDLILMDIELAGSAVNGIDICRILNGLWTKPLPEFAGNVESSCPIVFVTAYSALYTREELLASGGKELVLKPVDFTRLLLVISKLMVQGALQQPGAD